MQAGFCDSSAPENTHIHTLQLQWNDSRDGVTGMSIPRARYGSVDSESSAGTLIAQLGHCVQSGFGGRPVRAVQAFPAGWDAADSLALRPSQSECIGCQLHLAGPSIGSAQCQSLSLGFSQKGFNFNSLSSKPRPRDGEGSWLTKYFYQHWNCSAAQNGLKNQCHWPENTLGGGGTKAYMAKGHKEDWLDPDRRLTTTSIKKWRSSASPSKNTFRDTTGRY